MCAHISIAIFVRITLKWNICFENWPRWRKVNWPHFTHLNINCSLHCSINVLQRYRTKTKGKRNSLIHMSVCMSARARVCEWWNGRNGILNVIIAIYLKFSLLLLSVLILTHPNPFRIISCLDIDYEREQIKNKK